jgi:DNA ligase-1
MLSPGEDPMSYPKYFSGLQFPLLCSYKLDGIRTVVKNGVCMSRTGKPIPSIHAQKLFSGFEHLDGELIVGNPFDFNVYHRTMSHIMSVDKPHEDIRFYPFDYTAPEVLNTPFLERLHRVGNIVNNSPALHVLEHTPVESVEELLALEEDALEKGYEGLMLRSIEGRYKNGRATFREGIIYKLKRFTDDEAVVVDMIQQHVNNNEKHRDELGYAKRSTSKEGLEAIDRLGKFVCIYKGAEILVAPGAFTHSERDLIWKNKDAYLGKLLKFRYFGHGVKDKPRMPRATGFRDINDI